MKISPRSRNPRGFTLIEVMTVVTIVALLAAMSFGGFQVAQNRARTSDTVNRIRAIEMNLEKYYGDNGEYPEPAATETPATVNGQSYDVSGAVMLYQAVSGDGDDAIKGGSLASTGEIGSTGKVYWEEAIAPTPEDIEKKRKKQFVGGDESGLFFLVDAWSNPFQYIKAIKNRNKKVINIEDMHSSGDFEIWSYGKLDKPLEDTESQQEWVASWNRQ